MTLRLRHLKSLSSFNFGEKESRLSNVSPTLRHSLSRLEETGKPTDPTSPVALDIQFKEEWARIKEVVCSFYQAKYEPRIGRPPTFTQGQLSSLHDDIHTILLSKAGTFIFEFFQSSLLPTANELLMETIKSEASDLVSNLTAGWQHFYTHILPAVEAIFINVKSPRLSVRQATLLAFRDQIVLNLEPQLGLNLSEIYDEGSVSPALKQMMLVLQNVSECYPPSKKRLQCEKLTARIVSPYLGFYGLYNGGQTDPILPSNELEVAHLRRISVVDPRRLNRPLSVSSSLHMETLSDLFVLSADRLVKRSGSRESFVS